MTKLTLTPCRGLSIICPLKTGRSLVQTEYRGIAQSGSAPALGAGCREFESLYPDQLLATVVELVVLFSALLQWWP